jgi:hypothetical protein
MRKILFALTTLLLTSNFISAQNNLSVFSEDGLPFYLILNGIRQNEQPQTNIRMEALTADYYAAKIIFNDQSLGEIEKKFLGVNGPDCNPCDVTYKIKYDKKGELTLKPFSFTPLAMAPPPPANVQVVQYNTAPMPAPTFGVQITETTTTHTTGTSDNVSMGVNVGGFNMGVNVNVNDGFGGTSQTTTTTTTTTMTNVQPTQTVVAAQPVCPPMSTGSFNSLLNTINNQGFDDDKVMIAKQATSSNCMYVGQIKQVMNALSFEDSKLEFAKYAYAYCVDPQNYFQINDAFDFSSSVEELNNHISR